jgi:hypothetical protein
MSIPYAVIWETNAQGVKHRTCEIEIYVDDLCQLNMELKFTAMIALGAAVCFLDLVI